MKTVTGVENVLDEMRRGAVLMANGCTAMLKRPDDSAAFVNRGTLRALLERSALFVVTRSGPSELQYRLLESLLAWIPVAERLPDDDRDVLVVDDQGERWLGYYDHGDEGRWFYCGGELATIRFWMEMPPAPAGMKAQTTGAGGCRV
jgi:hypothetical protein